MAKAVKKFTKLGMLKLIFWLPFFFFTDLKPENSESQCVLCRQYY